MIVKICKYCSQTLEFNKSQQFAHHVSKCEANPNSALTKQKIKETQRNKKIELSLNCKKCTAEYKILATPYEIRSDKIRHYCSLQCANSRIKATFYNCLCCQKECRRHANYKNKFCSNACQHKFEFQTITLKRFEQGEISERLTIKKILTKLNGYSCSVCEIKEWNDLPITLQVDHIDGNAGNSLPNNVRLICPNCHTQTKTWGGKNKGNGRKSRGLSLS